MPNRSESSRGKRTQTAYLSLGSNMGDRRSNIRLAVDRLAGDVHVLAVSSLYETTPFGVVDQPPFLNLAISGSTDLSARDLLRYVKRVESELGRVPTYRWGPRLIDIDIILFGDEVIQTAELTVPHREMTHRAFVLVPLSEIAPDIRHPIVGETVSQLRDTVEGRAGVRRLDPD